MKLCVVTCTYNRPNLLPRVIRCFEEQDYEDRCMLIYDDGGQFGNLEGDRWKLISVPDREKTLGQKRNRSVELAEEHFPGIDAILPCDDDDLFLPWHLSSSAAALSVADWSRPSVVLAAQEFGGVWIFTANYTGHKDDQTKNRVYHPAWAMRLSMFKAMGGYPAHLSGPEDKGLMRKMEEAGVSEADQIEFGCPPSYVYIWGSGNISGLLSSQQDTGEKAWESLGRHLRQAELHAWEPTFDLHCPIVAPGIRPRPF